MLRHQHSAASVHGSSQAFPDHLNTFQTTAFRGESNAIGSSGVSEETKPFRGTIGLNPLSNQPAFDRNQ